MIVWQPGLITLLQTLTQILTAGIAITAFSLLIYALTFNLRDRVARSFALILICVVVVFSADALGSTTSDVIEMEMWLRMQWVGIIILPAAYLHFSDALLATTGKPSRGRRRWAVRLSYFASALFLLTVPFMNFVGKLILDEGPAPYLQPSGLTVAFLCCYLGAMLVSWFNFRRAYLRTTNLASRRRMVYLITGAAAPALGSFPFLLFGSGFAQLHPIVFWLTAFLSNLMVGVLLVVMAYAVAFFGVSWTDRVVKARLFKWLMRGPVTASITLGLVTIVRRLGELVGVGYSAFVPITMVGTILLLEHLITLFSPLGERFLFDGNDHTELDFLRKLEDRLLTQNDLSQFLEMILSAVRDRLQAHGAYIATLDGEDIDIVARSGKVTFNPLVVGADAANLLHALTDPNGPVKWNGDYLFPLVDESSLEHRIIGILGVVANGDVVVDGEGSTSLSLLGRRAALALRDRQIQQQVFQSLQDLTPQVDLIQALRASSRYNETQLFQDDVQFAEQETHQWVKEALTHYWGGPKLTESPLIQLKLVQDTAEGMEGNTANALRAVLREAIDRLKPEGERKFTSEWMLYNILDMKFMEGRKVRDIALRLAMSEADLYRKQRVAIEAVAKVILEMESHSRQA
jgi:hypothetical protein